MDKIKHAPTAAMRELTNVGGKAAPEREDYSDANYDEWSGYSGSLFASVTDDAEDKDADSVFSKVEDYIDGRRRKKREEKMKE